MAAEGISATQAGEQGEEAMQPAPEPPGRGPRSKRRRVTAGSTAPAPPLQVVASPLPSGEILPDSAAA
eukprot:11386727-Alexandrium_andersonii.AAC.1